MFYTAEFLIAVGGILLLGLATDFLGRHTFLPRVTLLLLFGILIGDQGLALIPAFFLDRFELITDMALLMIGFLLGGRLTRDSLSRNRAQLLFISITAALLTSLTVLAGLILLGLPFPVALLLGCIAAATAPAATVDTVLSSGSPKPFANLLLLIVAIDDIWALLLFSLSMAWITSINGGADAASPLLQAGYEIGGALALGLALGLPASYLTGRLRPGQPLLTEALGLVLLCGGLAIWLEVSFLIASMAMGMLIANLASHHDYAFHEIENIEWPLMVIFFVLAGASLDIELLQQLGAIGLTYVLCRTLGKIVGGWLGGSLSGAPAATRRWIGIAMLPQAGVPVGMALVAANQFPEYRQLCLSIVIGTTVLFELLGPVLTRLALRKAAS
ncbi:cation:proton antiporter [Marinobacterium arenosum]|uniref:cation:proton antiporter n=1 Tax=Marinobacterium arenosum TaxID=2862496 RepID=UPI001C982FD5|nr:cation:proton antiporter [Marinobacterium arenosum]MBY4676957.1 cation:proton antiporter [Marinobacterium arenosum]